MIQFRREVKGPVTVSYLTSAYNHADYVVDCLNSVVADMDSNSEIVIGNDGSTDTTATVIQRWIGEHPSVAITFISRENRGISATLNELLEIATGRYVRFTASDDMVIKGTTQVMRELLERNLEKLVVVGDVTCIDKDGQTSSRSYMEWQNIPIADYQADIRKAVISKWAIAGPAGLYKSNFKEVVGNFDEKLVVEDWSLFLRLVAGNFALFIPQQVGLYRLHETNTSRTMDVRRRLINLNAQITAGVANLPLFSGKYRWLLKAEIFLLNAKTAYLQKQIFNCFLFMVKYFFAKVVAR